MASSNILDRIEELKDELGKRGIPLDSIGDLPDTTYYAVGLGAKLGIDPELVLDLEITLDEAMEWSSGRVDLSTSEA